MRRATKRKRNPVIRRRKTIPKVLMNCYLKQNLVRISTRQIGEVRGYIYNIEIDGEIKIMTERGKLITISISDILEVKE